MLGGGANARWESGTFQNEYVKESGVWKIARLHFYPQFGGPYDKGWTNVSNPLAADSLLASRTRRRRARRSRQRWAPRRRPRPRWPASSSASIASRPKTSARNLQNAYGYYVDRKMWDDVTDLFTADGVLEIAARRHL